MFLPNSSELTPNLLLWGTLPTKPINWRLVELFSDFHECRTDREKERQYLLSPVPNHKRQTCLRLNHPSLCASETFLARSPRYQTLGVGPGFRVVRGGSAGRNAARGPHRLWCPVFRQFKKLYARGTVAAGSLQASARTVKGLVIKLLCRCRPERSREGRNVINSHACPQS